MTWSILLQLVGIAAGFWLAYMLGNLTGFGDGYRAAKAKQLFMQAQQQAMWKHGGRRWLKQAEEREKRSGK